jgi:hypothetical protein
VWGRKHISIKQMPDHSAKTLARLTIEDLYRYLAGWAPNTAQHVAARAELDRRQSKPARVAAWVAVATLVATVVGWFTH